MDCQCETPVEREVRVCAHCWGLKEDEFYVECATCIGYVREVA
jgi:hypothetical protein